MNTGKTETQGTTTIMKYSSLVYYTLTLAIVWTMAIVFFTTWNINQKKQTTRELATKEARAHFNKDQAFRFWSTTHGGVYVPANKRTQPNPHLKHIPERDIITASGKKLTLMNPAYMLRQMMDDYSLLYEVKGRITSLKPFRSQNTPDEWERSALKAFESGVEEVFEFVDINSEPYLRLIRPMITKKGCLKCHGYQGYKVGDVRGGVGVSVPMSSYLTQEGREIRQLMISYLLIWLLGIGGIYLGFRGLRQRIAERAKAEIALVESERKYRSMMEAMKDPSYICTPDFHVEYMNSAMINRTGSDATGESCFKAIHNLEEKCPWCMHDKVQQSEHCEQEVFSPKNNCTYHISNSPIVHVNGSISKMAVFRNITESKLAEESVRLSEQRFRDLFESITDLIYTQDLDGRFTSVNPAMHRLFGYDINEFIGHRATDFMKPELRFEFRNRYLEVVKKQGSLDGISCYFKKNKEKIYIEYKSSLVEPDDGEPYISGIGRDVTEKILSEKKVKKLQEQVVQVQKMESIGTLAGGIAHDFNNILFPVLGYTEMLLQDIPENSPTQDSLKKIYSGAIRAKELVNQILTFSRQGSCELKLMKMQPIIKEVLKLIRSTIPTTINIKQDINANCGLVTADPTQIHQIIMNLTTNAYHAMEETGGDLKVTLKEIELDEYDVITPEMISGTYACLTIADTGMGMDKNLIEKIFDPFFTTKKIGKGTGMGLSVVHGIVKSMNGVIKVYSEPDKGTEFHIYLPVIKSPSEKQESNQMKEPILGGIERILLVDDEDEVASMEKLILERLGYQVTSFTSSMEALESFRAAPEIFDLIITDMAMPNISGDKLAVELVKIRSDIPILLCTGFSETMSEEKAASLGIKGFLLKPIIMKDLSKKIRELLDATNGRGIFG